MQATIEDVIEKGDKADSLLSNPVLNEALQAIRADAMNRFAGTQVTQTDVRESCFHLVHAIDLLENKLRSYKGNGQIEKTKLKQRAKR